MIELGKKYRTRDGLEVRIYAVDGGGKYPVHGAFLNILGAWQQAEWTRDGSYVFDGGGSHPLNLIEVRPEVTVRQFLFLLSDGRVSFCEYGNSGSRAARLGAIDITHDGEKLIKVEVVK